MKYEKIIIDIASDYIYNNDLKNYLKDIKFINNSEQKVPYIAGYDSNNKIILFVSEDYLSYADETGFSNFIDFSFMKTLVL